MSLSLARSPKVTTAERHIEPSVSIGEVWDLEGRLTADEIAHHVTERLRAANRNDSWERRRLWPRNLLYLYGEQDLLWDYERAMWSVRKVARTRSFKTNFLQARLSSFVAALTQHRPSLTALPLNDDLESVRQARVAEKVFAFDWRDLKISRARDFATIDSAALGMGILELGWNPDGGPVRLEYEPQIDPADGRPLLDDLGNEVPELDPDSGRPVVRSVYPSGRIYVRSVSPFSFFVPPGLEEPTLDDAPWVQRIRWMTEGEIRTKFSKDRDGGQVDDDFELNDPDPELADMEPLTQHLTRYAVTGYQPRSESGLYMVIQHYERRQAVKGWERGRIFSVVNGQLVGDHESDFESGRYPFVLLPWLPCRGRFWPAAWLTPQVEVQARYNMAITHWMTLLAITGNPIYFVPKGAGLPNALSFDLRGYPMPPSGLKPEFMVPPTPSPAIAELRAWAIQDLDGAGGQYSFSRGQPVQNVPSALYAQMMADKDASDLGPAIRSAASATEELGQALMELHREHDSDERMLTIVGETSRCDYQAFKGSDLPEEVRFVAAESTMGPSVPAARQAAVTEYVLPLVAPANQPPDPKVTKALLAYMNLPELGEIETGTRVMDKFVERTLYQVIEEGEQVEPSPLWPAAAAEAILTAIDERVLREDVIRWGESTTQRVGQFKETLQKILAAATQAQEDEAKRKLGLQLEAEAAAREIETKATIKENVITEAAKTALPLAAAEVAPPIVDPSAPDTGEEPPMEEA